MSVHVYYLNHETDVRTELDLEGDPFEVCNAVRARLFHDVKPPDRDEKFEALMWARKALDAA